MGTQVSDPEPPPSHGAPVPAVPGGGSSGRARGRAERGRCRVGVPRDRAGPGLPRHPRRSAALAPLKSLPAPRGRTRGLPPGGEGLPPAHPPGGLYTRVGSGHGWVPAVLGSWGPGPLHSSSALPGSARLPWHRAPPEILVRAQIVKSFSLLPAAAGLPGAPRAPSPTPDASFSCCWILHPPNPLCCTPMEPCWRSPGSRGNMGSQREQPLGQALTLLRVGAGLATAPRQGLGAPAARGARHCWGVLGAVAPPG